MLLEYKFFHQVLVSNPKSAKIELVKTTISLVSKKSKICVSQSLFQVLVVN